MPALLQVIQIGRQTFNFTVRQEDRVCDLVQLPPAGGAAATEIGSVKQTLIVKVCFHYDCHVHDGF